MTVVEKLQWYDTFIYLVGVIVAIADPITDIWTSVVFYRSGHTNWSAVGITFVILPSLIYPVVNYFNKRYQQLTMTRGEIVKQLVYSFHPFAPALSRLLVFISCCKNFKQMWRYSGIETIKSFPRRGDRREKLGNVIAFGMTEATLEAAPQFLIQLYAMTVQQEKIEVIQMISLPVSFLSLVWTVTKFEFNVYNNDDELPELSWKDKVIIFVCHFLLLSSRMLSVAFFTIAYKWWILAVMLFHCLAVLLISLAGGHCCQVVDFQVVLMFVGISWLSWIDFSLQDFTRKTRWVLQWLPYLMHTVENTCMILAFYFASEATTWYVLAATVLVCVLSPCGSAWKLFYSRVILKRKLKRQKIKEEHEFQRREIQERELENKSEGLLHVAVTCSDD